MTAYVLASLAVLGLGGCGGVQPRELSVESLDGSTYRPIPSDLGIPTVLLFTATDCPVANGYAPRIRALHAEYAGPGMRFFVVNVEPDATVEALREHALAYDLPGPILLDRDHALARFAGAQTTPEAVVLLPGGAVAYRGRIDDQVPSLGVRRPAATTSELRDALDAVLNGRPVAVPRAPAVGCLIEDWAH